MVGVVLLGVDCVVCEVVFIGNLCYVVECFVCYDKWIFIEVLNL